MATDMGMVGRGVSPRSHGLMCNVRNMCTSGIYIIITTGQWPIV